ncbi:HAMP domain-containing histidine kinase [Streptomyces natalensis]|uniref:Histidine kinase/HSP90-like ATPase domain-containing protein n=1 Tax=Streptomyces natalensis ATCC 27448 TaxID=1240678 RepID=A0A0D7CIL9_9ACTN|nr:hypothetical protein SNA_27050 [Streptomyces natalensis ATCC 27448]
MADAQHDGTGLGLPMVRQLTHASGGEVTLRPAPRAGVDAVVRLRLAPHVAERWMPTPLVRDPM